MTTTSRQVRNKVFFLFVFLAGFWWTPPEAPAGKVYMYRDANGVVHLTDNPPSGKDITVIETPDGPPAEARPEAPPKPPPPPPAPGPETVRGEPDDYFMYRDPSGTIHFTNAPTDSRFRPFKIKTLVIAGGGFKPIGPVELRPHILAAAKLYNLDPALILAVIKTESAFDPRAVSWAGAQGLMQLMPGTAVMMGVKNPFDPRENIFGGCRFLRMMLDRFGDVRLALAAYNCGPERVDRVGRIPNIRETKAYVKRVLLYYEQFKQNKG